MLGSSFALIFVSLACPSVFGQNDYCDISSAHTMCQYKPRACRKPSFESGLSESDREAILTAHNNYRSKVANKKQPGQPSASNMKELQWDDELESIAQRWADQCSFGHDDNRNTINNERVGQNVAITQSSRNSDRSADFEDAIKMWYDEVEDPGFNPRYISPFVFSSGTGHYTQIVWAETDRIGCGYSYYKDGSWYSKFYVCNYFIAGNIQRGEMYKQGPAASQCDGKKSRNYPGLCGNS